MYNDISATSPIQMALISALQDAPGTKEDKKFAVACVFQKMMASVPYGGPTAADVLEAARHINNLGKEYPEFKAVSRFIANELN